MSRECQAAEHAEWARIMHPSFREQIRARIERSNAQTPEYRYEKQQEQKRQDWAAYLRQEGIISDVE